MTVRWDRNKGRPEPIRALNRVREVECGEPLVDLRSAAPSVTIARPQTIPWCRATVAEMAERAARSLPPGVRLAVTDAWRPIDRQRRIYEWLTQCALEVWPDLTHSALRRKINRWVAPVDQKAPPGHCTGAALDVILIDDQNEPIDVFSPYDRFKAAPTYTLGLDPEARRNRDLLVEAMLAAGFSNCRDEWWHYSFGDAGWAVRLGFDECRYGLILLPRSEYEEQERIWIEEMKSRPNPFRASGS
jgi:D-alanyl-D-alanine dipeptidase